jgi:endonuclease/exonuclease/phosphatase (EEP) superfamily protein YafD
MTRLRAASLNVNGGETVAGAERPVKEVIAQLANDDYDVLLLQEFPERLLAQLCDSLPGWAVRSWMLSEAERSNEGSVGLVTICRYDVRRTQRVAFPNPDLAVRLPDDRICRSHDKGALVVTLDIAHLPDPVQVANVHALPFHRFGVAEDSDQVEAVWSAFGRCLSTVISLGHPNVVIGGDFNSCTRQAVNGVLGQWGLNPLFSTTPTRPGGRTTDDIYVYSRKGRTSQLGQPQDVGSDHLQIAVELTLARSKAFATSSSRRRT